MEQQGNDDTGRKCPKTREGDMFGDWIVGTYIQESLALKEEAKCII